MDFFWCVCPYLALSVCLSLFFSGICLPSVSYLFVYCLSDYLRSVRNLSTACMSANCLLFACLSTLCRLSVGCLLCAVCPFSVCLPAIYCLWSLCYLLYICLSILRLFVCMLSAVHLSVCLAAVCLLSDVWWWCLISMLVCYLSTLCLLSVC